MKIWLIVFIVVIFAGLGVWFGFQSSHVTVQTITVPTAPPVNVTDVKTKAEAGDPAAMAQLGSLYSKGQGVTNDYKEAAKWFRAAADKGNADGQLGLGELYEAGQGVPKDEKEALKLYQLAADQGHPRAQYTLAFLYEAGSGVKQDHVKAAKLFLLAAEQGDALSQYDLGQRYDLGVGVPVDLVESLKWLMLAAAQGQSDSIARLDQVKRKASSEQIAEAKRRVAAFVPKRSQTTADSKNTAGK